MGRIFISYRRDDTVGHAGRLYDRLAERFGKEHVYRDLDTIESGENFVEAIRDAVRRSDVVLALIGPRWLTATDESGQWRLASEDDAVRLEIAAALEQKIRVIPVVCAGAKMPRVRDLPSALAGLAQRNAVEIRDTHFDHDVAQLSEILGRPRWHYSLRRAAPHMVAVVFTIAVAFTGWRVYQHVTGPLQARRTLAEIGMQYTPDVFVERAAKNDERAVQLFLRAGMDPNLPNKEHQTALMWAAGQGQVPMTKLLIAHGAQIDAALRWAADKDQADIVEMLLRQHPSTTAVNEALHVAAGQAATPIVQSLLRHGADVNSRRRGGYTPLIAAARQARLGTVRLLIQSGADVKATRDRGWTALHEVASVDVPRDVANHLGIVRALLDRGADVNARAEHINGTKGWTPVLLAVWHRADSAIVSLLLDWGADANAKSEYEHGAAAMTLALLRFRGTRGNETVLAALVAKGANVNAGDDTGRTPLMVACAGRETDATKFLVTHGADVNAADTEGRSALMFAARFGRPDTVEALLQAGARVNTRNANGGTALIWAAQRGETAIVKLLLSRGASVNDATRSGKTALMIAAEEGYPETLRVLLEHGADADARDENGYTALMLADAKGEKKTAGALRYQHGPTKAR